MAEGNKRPGLSADHIRHSKAEYKTYARILASDNPTGPFDSRNQVTPDLTEEGRKLAEREADKYFTKLDPKNDALFFVSSNEARAIETANIYRKIAHGRGFEIIKPEHARSAYAEDVGEGEIRVSKTLSIDAQNMLLEYIFNAGAGRKLIHWEAVDEETRKKFEQAVAVVDADNQGTFGANFLKHSEKVKGLIPEITSAYEMYQKKFNDMLRLLRWAERKAAKFEGDGKGIKILAFGHENAFLYPIQEFFEEDGLKNCEFVEFSIEDAKIIARFRGKEHAF